MEKERGINIVHIGALKPTEEMIREALSSHEKTIIVVGNEEIPRVEQIDGLTEDIINHFSRVMPSIESYRSIGEFSESDTKKAIAKQVWSRMTYDERKKHKPTK